MKPNRVSALSTMVALLLFHSIEKGEAGKPRIGPWGGGDLTGMDQTLPERRVHIG